MKKEIDQSLGTEIDLSRIALVIKRVKESEMNSTMKMEDTILSVAAFACYVFALTTCGIAIYALLTLSLTPYGNPGQDVYLRAWQF